jgi:hypothetical protein
MSTRGINAIGYAIFGRLPFCAISGALAGVITGTFFSLAQALHPVQLTTVEVIGTGLVLGLIGLVAILIVLVLLFHYRFAAVFGPAVVTALIVGVVVVAVLNSVQRPPLGPLLGFVIGLVVGALLCYAACRVLRREVRG